MEGNARRAVLALAILLAALVVALRIGHRAKAAPAERASACIFDHLTLRTVPGTCRPRARAYPGGVKSQVHRAIYDASLTFGVPYATLLQVAWCESSLNSRASNGRYYGLYQFDTPTFRQGAHGMKKETGIVAKTYWDPLDAAYVAGYLFVVGQSGRWTCS